MNYYCSICEIKAFDLTLASETDSNNVPWSNKLSLCIPEIKDLCQDLLLCGICVQQLELSWSFRKLCLQSNFAKKLNITGTEVGIELLVINKTEENVIEDDKNIDIQETNLDSGEDLNLCETFTCFHCGETYFSKDKLLDHINTSHRLIESLHDGNKQPNKLKPKDISNVCHVCGMTFNSPYLIKRHINNVHAQEKNYRCDLCDQKFTSLVYLNAHKRYHNKVRSYICSFCGKRFITGSDLYHHEKIHLNKRAYKCDLCGKAFNTSSDLHKHKLCVHQDKRNWKYVCIFCDRRFPLKTNMVAHVKTHTGERNFPCHLCDRKCVNRSVLLRHIKSHSNVRLYKCNTCNLEYKYQKSLNIHLKKVHGVGNAKIPERVKKHFCHICPKSYFANNKLQKHIRTHTGERPFSCELCDKRFIDKSYVKQHLKTIHNVNTVTASIS